MDKEQFKESRISCIKKIMHKLEQSRSTLMPTATAERFLDEALRCVVHIVSRKEYVPTEGTSSRDLSTHGRTMDRKQCLKKIFDQLCWMERNRLYDPPGDNEIGHYLLIKKYTRLIMAFNVAAGHDRDDINMFGCGSLFLTLHFAEELMEVNQHLGDLSVFLLEMNTEDAVPKLAPLMGTKDSYEAMCVTCGSKDRNYMVYYHKFLLALVDLRSSEFASCPPLEDEERSYVQVLDALPLPSNGVEDERNVCSEELLNLYVLRINKETDDIERNFAEIKGWILKNLSLIDWWDAVADETHATLYEEYDYHELAAFRKELTDKCEIPNEDLPGYISQVDHYLTIALLVEAFVYNCMVERPTFNSLRCKKRKKFEWEIIHALTLLKHGCLTGSVLREQPILRNLHKLESSENHHSSRKCEHILHQQGQEENVVILEGIIDDLRRIGDSYSILNKEEMTLLHKIWGSVASTTHFFVSAMAYNQRKYIIQHYESFDFSMVGLQTAFEVSTLTSLDDKQDCLENDVTSFVDVLIAYKIGLGEKLRSS